MSTLHSKAAEVFLNNAEKAKWHDATFWSVRTKRDNMAKNLDEWEQLRQMASDIKRHTITHMDEYLDRFATNAENNGVTVHWAKDAREFNGTVLDILRSHGVKTRLEESERKTIEAVEKSENVMDLLIRIYRLRMEALRQTHPLFYVELTKYPDVLEYLQSKDEEKRKHNMEFVERGGR